MRQLLMLKNDKTWQLLMLGKSFTGKNMTEVSTFI